MCNLSEGIEKRGEARGEARGRVIGEARGDERRMKIVATNMINRGKYSPEEIADISGMAIEKVRELMDGKTA